MARTPFCSQVLLGEGGVVARLQLESQNSPAGVGFFSLWEWAGIIG